jgi:hypothetical protein
VNYMVIVRAYKNNKTLKGVGKTAYILTIRPIHGTAADELHYVLRKLSVKPIMY